MTDLKAWLIETIKRTKAPGSPYFKYWGKINVVLMIVSGLPDLLLQVDKVFEINTFNNAVPHEYWIRIMLKIIFGAAAWGKIISSLSVNSSHEIVQDGEVLLQKPCGDLPYTEKKTGISIVEPTQTNT